MNLQEFTQAFLEGNGASQLQLRDEKSQHKQYAARFSQVKREKGLKAKIFVVKEIALPFDPLTGATDVYSVDLKWRPSTSVYTTIKMLKEYFNSNEEAKKVFLERMHAEEWDTSDFQNHNDADFEIFKPFLVPRTYSFNSVIVRCPSMKQVRNGKSFDVSFWVDVKRDPMTLEIVGEKPLIIKAGEFFNAVAQEEINEYNSQIKAGTIKDDDNTQKAHRSTVRQKMLVTLDNPKNLVQVVMVPLNNLLGYWKKGENADAKSAEELNDLEVKEARSYLKITTGNENFGTRMDELKPGGSYADADIDAGYWESDMVVPNEDDDNKRGKNTTYGAPKNNALATGALKQFLEVMAEVQDSVADKAENMAIAGSYLQKYDEKHEDVLREALRVDLDLENKYVTEKVLLQFEDFIREIKGAEVDELYGEISLGVSDREEGTYDSSTAIAEGKAVDLASAALDSSSLMEDDEDETVETQVVTP